MSGGSGQRILAVGDAIGVSSGAYPGIGDGLLALFSREFTSGQILLSRNGIPLFVFASACAVTASVLGSNDSSGTLTGYDSDVYEFGIVSGALNYYKRVETSWRTSPRTSARP